MTILEFLAVGNHMVAFLSGSIKGGSGEIDLTDAFIYAINHQNLLGYIVDGESFDLGNANAYLYTGTNYKNK